MAVSTKPFILICATPAISHLLALGAIATDLLKRGYEVTILGATVRRDFIDGVGASFAPLLGRADFFCESGRANENFPQRKAIPEGPEQIAFDMDSVFVSPIAAQFDSIQRVLQGFKKKDASRPVVILNEGMFLGAIPLLLGAPGLQPTGLISIGVAPVALSSIDTAPFGVGLFPDSSPQGRERNRALTKMAQEDMFGRLQDRFQKVVQSVGAAKCPYFVFDAPYLLSHYFLQLCHPDLEYVRSDAPENIIFAGVIPHGEEARWNDKPAWWEEITTNTSRQKIVFVSQGTVALDYSDLIIPSLKALKDVPNVLVVVALGRRGNTLPAEVVIPDNVRVTDFIPYHEALAHADVFLCNGGYGGFQQSVGQGVPIIIAGASEEKPEVAARAEYAGVGINLRTKSPTPEAIREAVKVVLNDPIYTNKVISIQAKMSQLDPFSILVQKIDDLVASKHVVEQG
ncbi:udp-glucuronosyl udp-glucosyltransferase [Phlyctema vagabunda]|uniref:Udp-glucuronosyl udp-glucosyltransferase n=1 Tax=Phlyctema vagabunda TaxID=108571 RepID=A0ABR4PJK5_9HELO